MHPLFKKIFRCVNTLSEMRLMPLVSNTVWLFMLGNPDLKSKKVLFMRNIKPLE